MSDSKWQDLAKKIGEKHDADVILYSGDIDSATADIVIRLGRRRERHKNVVFLLTTRGGSPDAAYRIARCLQSQYENFILYIYGICKSAGTLIAIGANEIVLSDFGEFGPLDVQLGKKDEIFENVSGLNLTQALTSLNTRVLDLFRTVLIELRSGSNGQISTKLAAEIASKLATGAYETIYSQVDPGQLGSIERAINIASDYGERLTKGTKNVKRETVDKLVSSYPSHSFIIDRKEAETLFEQVRKPDEDEEELAESINWLTRDPAGPPLALLLNIPEEPQDESNTEANANQSAAGEESGGSENNQAADTESDGTVTEGQPRSASGSSS